MKIDSTLTTIKNVRRRVMGYSAHFHSLGTAREHLTKDEATTDLAAMIAFRCKYESAEVKIVTVRGHVGVFSYNLFGDIASRHVWPDGMVALSIAHEPIAESVTSFRYHVAQMTWDGTLEPSDILTSSDRGCAILRGSRVAAIPPRVQSQRPSANPH